MKPHMNIQSERLLNKAVASLGKEFIVLGHTRVRSWHAWLTIGLVVGIAAGVILVANRSGEFESSLAATSKDPVIYFPFDEGAGAAAMDIASNVKASLSGSTSWVVNGISNKALTFGGSSNPGSLTFSLPSTFSFNDGFTISTWARPTAPGNYSVILDNRFQAPIIWVRPDNTFALEAYDYSSRRWFSVKSARPVDLNSWYHLTATYDKSELRLYIDGEVAGSVPYSGLFQRGGNIRLGNDITYDQTGPIYAWKGEIDELKIYNRVLSGDEIYSAYSQIINSADKLIALVPLRRQEGGQFFGCTELTDADLDLWKSRGVDAFICNIQNLYRMGGSHDFNPDLAADLTAQQYDAQRRIIDSKIVERAKARGIDLYLGFYLTNYFNVKTPLAEWFDDAGWANEVLPKIRDLSAAANKMGFAGLSYDSELYQQIQPSTASWRWNYLSNTHTEAEVRAKIKQRGAEMMRAILGAFPNAELIAYESYFPESEDVAKKLVNKIDDYYQNYTHIDFVDGLTSVPGYKTMNIMTEAFYKQPIYQYFSWEPVLQENYNLFYSMLSRRLSNWDYAAPKISRSMFVWIDQPPAGSPELNSFTSARTPERVTQQLDAFKRWGNGGKIVIFGQQILGGSFDYAPYVAAMQSASAPTTVDKEAPSFFVGAPDGSKIVPPAGIAIGDWIITSNSTSVRNNPYITSAGSVVIGTQPKGALGIVIGGPVDRGGRWWQINYDNGVDGWSQEILLQKAPRPAPASGTYLIAADNISVSGYAKDNYAVQFIRWENNRGGSGTAEMNWRAFSGDRATGWKLWQTDWQVDIPLRAGENILTFTAQDTKGLTSSKTITIMR